MLRHNSKRTRAGRQAGGIHRDGLLQEGFVPVVCLQEGLDFAAYQNLTAARRIQELFALRRIELESCFEHTLDLAPFFGSHCVSFALISRRSQVRAVAHSRLMVVREIPITSAVSSIDKPPKKRISTILHCCGSRRSSSLRALSRAIKSTFWAFFSLAMASCSSSFSPPPRFAARCARA